MAYTIQQLIDMSLTVYDLRTAMQKFYAECQGLDTNPSGGGTDITSTDELAEGTKNLYFTPQRVRNTAIQGITLLLLIVLLPAYLKTDIKSYLVD